MKQIKPEQIKPDKQVIIPAEEKKTRFIGRQRMKKGHTVYQWKDGIVSEAEVEEVEVALTDKSGLYEKRKKLILKKECYYMPALNLKNAIRKFQRSGLKIEDHE